MSHDREPEKRHDLSPVAGQNKMGGERFTIITRTKLPGGAIFHTEKRNQPIENSHKV